MLPPDMTASSTHLVLLPSYDTGPRLVGVVTEVLRHWQPVLVVIDGSTDGSAEAMRELAQSEPGLSVIVLPQNAGKGAAVLAGLAQANERGFTHALVMDADGQHPAAGIAEFMEVSRRHPGAMVLGRPIFGPEVPLERLYGRKISVGFTQNRDAGARPLLIRFTGFGFIRSSRCSRCSVRAERAGATISTRLPPCDSFGRASSRSTCLRR